jgi:hypothetical protein
MSEESGTIETKSPELSHRRILILMALVVLIGTALGITYRTARFGLGVLVGGILAGANYYWLKSALGAIFEKAIRDGKKPRFLISGYLLRYVFVALALVLIYFTGIVDFVACLAGLASLAVAITIEGIIRLILIAFNKREV